MKRKILFTLMSLLSFGIIYAQESRPDDYYFSTDSNTVVPAAKAATQADVKSSNNPNHFGLQMGTSFSKFSGRGSMFSNYVAPSWNRQFSPRMNLEVGTVVVNNQLNNLTAPSVFDSRRQPKFNGSFSQFLIYAKGQYLLSNRLLISGSSIKSFSSSPVLSDFNAATVGIDYKITDNIQIGASFSYSNGYNPYDPYSRWNSGYNSFYGPYNQGW